MDTISMFLRLAHANLKRLKSYIVPIIASVLILLISCGTLGYFISENLYKKEEISKITLAYYFPIDDELSYNLIGLSFFENLESVKNTTQLVQASTIEEGKAMVKNGDAEYFVIIPENFFSGIMYGDNPSIEIIIKEQSSVTAHMINELFLSYARYLGVAQASVYSALDTARAHNLSPEEIERIQNKVNTTFLDRALNKDNYTLKITAINQNGLTLINRYLASAAMLSIFLAAVLFMPLLKGFNKGIINCLSSNNIHQLHILACNFITTSVVLYMAYIPCHIALSIYNKSFNIKGFLIIIPVILIMALFITLIAYISKNIFTANIILLCFIILVSYIGGGILPKAFLPSIVQAISQYLPGEFMIDTIAKAIFM